MSTGLGMRLDRRRRRRAARSAKASIDGADLGVERAERVVQPEADAGLLEVGGRRPAGQRAGLDDREQQAQVARRAGHRADHVQVALGEGAGVRRHVAALGDHPPGGLVAKTPQKPAGTRSEPPMSEPISSAVTRAARAAAAPPDEPPRRAGRVPGIVGGAVERVGALPVGGHDRDVGLAPDHRPGVARVADGGGVLDHGGGAARRGPRRRPCRRRRGCP